MGMYCFVLYIIMNIKCNNNYITIHNKPCFVNIVNVMMSVRPAGHSYNSVDTHMYLRVYECLYVANAVNVAIFLGYCINYIIIVKLCMVVVLIELYPFIPIILSLIHI